MALVQIDEDQLKTYFAGYQLADRLLANPKTKRDAEKLIKTLHPEVTTSDDLAEPIVGPLKKELDDLKAWKKKTEDDALEGKFNNRFDDLKKSGYTEEGIEKIKKLMVDRNIPDVDAAAALFDRQNPAPKETPASMRKASWTIGEKGQEDTVQNLMKDPDEWARNEATKVLDELKQNPQPSFGAVGVG